MSTTYPHAPHKGDQGPTVQAAAPNAALLIDFDNVTMGMRSDLSKDLKKLLQSDVIRGKVTVQRAYADWRRYPQYIVPLSENSIDLIFAPAYGSSKKNATDIRMAIDGMELVFTRPEIGTFILLTGDSDFSSLVLKLKEYGKYVIGVGIQESSSDILVQNCDEYYSYNNLAGLQKTSESSQKPSDPWVLAEKALQKMQSRNDVMRSDRLKQVMIELDPSFDEGNFGFSKFSKFITEAASKGVVHLKKMENGQYEVSTTGGSGSSGGGRSRQDDRSRGRKRDESRRSEGGRDRSRARSSGEREKAPPRSEEATGDPLAAAYDLLRSALERAMGDDERAIRDSDVKRKMLEIDRDFDESELGFSKFSRFLAQADDDGVIVLDRRDSGNFEVALPGGGTEESATPGADAADEAAEEAAPSGPDEPATADEARGGREREAGAKPKEEEITAPSSRRREETVTAGSRLGPRRGSTRRRSDDDIPDLFEGQVVSVGATEPGKGGGEGADGGGQDLDLAGLGLPTDRDAAVRYLSNSYTGVGVKTAETLADAFGDDLFTVLHNAPERVHEVVPSNRAETVIDAWREDLRRRTERSGIDGGDGSNSGSPDRTRGRG